MTQRSKKKRNKINAELEQMIGKMNLLLLFFKLTIENRWKRDDSTRLDIAKVSYDDPSLFLNLFIPVSVNRKAGIWPLAWHPFLKSRRSLVLHARFSSTSNLTFLSLQLITLPILPFATKMESKWLVGTWTPVTRCQAQATNCPTSRQGVDTACHLTLLPTGLRHSLHNRIPAAGAIPMVI